MKHNFCKKYYITNSFTVGNKFYKRFNKLNVSRYYSPKKERPVK